jgi:hypothetical protein
MMPVLIQGPKQPENNIDVYLRPLVEELLLLWSSTGVRVWDEYKQEHFDVAPGFKDKTRYTPYVSPGSQISHIVTNKGNIKIQCLIYNVLSTRKITLSINSGK